MAKSQVKLEVREVDKGWKALQRMAADIKVGGYALKVGVLDNARRTSGITQAELAAVQHFGSKDGRIPSRPFIAMTFDKHREAYVQLLIKYLRSWYEQKMSADDVLNRIGLKIATDIKKTVTQGAGVPPPNAPSTIMRKLNKGRRRKVKQNLKAGRWVDKKTGQFLSADKVLSKVRTLIDTARMIGAVTWKVVTARTARGK
jgi:hypothetical protein